MCGIAGIICTNKNIINNTLLKKMSDALAHRGPNGEGQWQNETNNTGFSHRRLAIIDLSPAAAQPMHYLQRYSIVYNGEIYNYKEIKTTLIKEGYHFTTASDTEVILAAYDYYKENCMQYFDGMFAFAIWDEAEKKLFTARDVFGEKPFYYFTDKNQFVFASEMKALWATGIDKTANDNMIVNYLALGQVQHASDSSQTFFKNIFSLPPAHYGILYLKNMQFTTVRYKNIDKETCINITEADAAQQLEKLLLNSVSKRLRSDVAIGCSLSGGLDSSAISYLINRLQKNNDGHFKTFSAIFPGFKKDEDSFVKKIAAKFNLQNFTITPTANGLADDFAKLCYHQEEPFVSSSIYAQYKVYELAKNNNIKVLLDGQGADETLAGYTKYLHWYVQELIAKNKFTLAKKERAGFQKNNINMQWGAKNILAAYLPVQAAQALQKKANNKIAQSADINAALLHSEKKNENLGIYKPVIRTLNDILYFNTMQQGLQELLRYADRNSMAHGTEVRLPFLNIALVQFIFSLPSSLKIKNGFTKNILRQVMSGKLPDDIVWRTEKVGFEPPQKMWMNDASLQPVFYEAKEKLVQKKILNATVLQKKINPKAAQDEDNADWRYLSLAGIL